MNEFPYNNSSDEYIYSPAKRTITSSQTEDNLKCLSPFGPVSNMNCPKDNPTCNCPSAVFSLEPDKNEPTDAYLAELKNYTNECDYILSELGDIEWFGVDFSNPHSSYNCNYCSGMSGDNAISYKPVPTVPSGRKPYALLTDPSGNTGYYYNYDKRKTFDGSAFPVTFSNETGNLYPDCEKIVGDYFKYYKEYSNTNASFWNTPIKTPLLRRAQTALMMAQRIKILVNGDKRAKPGKMIFIDYPNFGGRWMIYKVERVITPQKHSMYLYLMRDGVE